MYFVFNGPQGRYLWFDPTHVHAQFRNGLYVKMGMELWLLLLVSFATVIVMVAFFVRIYLLNDKFSPSFSCICRQIHTPLLIANLLNVCSMIQRMQNTSNSSLG